MIIEMRSYTLQPGTVAAFEERFGQALPARARISPLAAFWHTEVGPLNRVIHVWPYDDLGARTRQREEATKLQGWPPNIREFLVELQIRIYTFKPGGIPGVIDRWSGHIEARTKLSPLVGAWYSELGGLNKWCHIWAYKDAADRFRIREEARAKGIWPPPSGGGPNMMIKQENMLVVPAAFSPLH